MAGTIVANTINTDTGLFSTQNAYQGIAKAWGSYAFVTNGTIPTLRSSFNISSITRSSNGIYTFTFTTATSDANYGVVASATYSAANSAQIAFAYSKSTTSFTVSVGYTNNAGVITNYDFGIDFVVNGN